MLFFWIHQLQFELYYYVREAIGALGTLLQTNEETNKQPTPPPPPPPRKKTHKHTHNQTWHQHAFRHWWTYFWVMMESNPTVSDEHTVKIFFFYYFFFTDIGAKCLRGWELFSIYTKIHIWLLIKLLCSLVYWFLSMDSQKQVFQSSGKDQKGTELSHHFCPDKCKCFPPRYLGKRLYMFSPHIRTYEIWHGFFKRVDQRSTALRILPLCNCMSCQGI